MKLFVAIAALAFGSSLVLAVPVDYDMQDLAAREVFQIEDIMAREYLSQDLEAREDELEEMLAREGGHGGEGRRGQRKGEGRRAARVEGGGDGSGGDGGSGGGGGGGPRRGKGKKRMQAPPDATDS